MEEAEKPDFPDVEGGGDREAPISKASKDKKEKEGDERKKSLTKACQRPHHGFVSMSKKKMKSEFRFEKLL